jgi:CHAT domain-containing protein/predicted negative regulator of RcsB-dependent stress response
VGEEHRYRLALPAGHYAAINVEQLDSDVVIRVLSASGSPLYEVDSPNGSQGREVAHLLGRPPGVVDLVVAGSEGRYRVSVEVLRRASAEDRKRAAAEEEFARGETLRRRNDNALLTTARKHHLAALALLRELGDVSRQSDGFERLGRIDFRLDRYEPSLGNYLQALALLPAEGREADRGAILDGIGRAYVALGEPDRALASYREALEIHRRAGDERQAGLTLNNLGRAYTQLGLTDEALEAFDEALRKLRSSDDAGNEGVVLSSQAVLYLDLGVHRRALDLLDEALPLLREANLDRPVAVALDRRGTALTRLGRFHEAVDAFNQALDLERRLGDRREEAVTLNNLAEARQRLGETAAARDAYRQALAIAEQLEERNIEKAALINLGVAAAGQPEEALAWFHRALPLAKGDRGAEATAYMGIAQAQRAQGDLASAQRAAETALERIESLRGEASSTALRSSFLATKMDYFRSYVDLLMERHRQQPGDGFATAALEADERARARGLLDELARGTAQRDGREDSALLDERTEVSRQLRAVKRRREALAKSKAPDVELRPLDREIRAMIEALNALPLATDPVIARPLRHAEIERLLADGDTLLLQYSLGQRRSFLWAVSAGRLAVHELPARDQIETQAGRAYDLLTAPDRSSARSAAQKALHALSASLLAPVAGELTAAKRLAIVADGTLYRIPFAALPHPDGNGECLLDRHEIVVLPSSSSLAALRAKRRAPQHAVAVVADPVFDVTDPRLSGKLSRSVSRLRSAEPSGFTRLPHATAEAESILSLAPKTSFAAFGFEANRSLLEDGRLATAGILHFATHAVVDAEQPELSGLALSTVDEQGNRREGFVYAYEIHDLDLAAELVVLSACETAVGKEVAGEGAMGLSRAFFIAGARRTVVSLWPVDDRATAALMAELYRALLVAGRSPAAALREAQRAIRARPPWRDPYFWAGFELQGDWS